MKRVAVFLGLLLAAYFVARLWVPGGLTPQGLLAYAGQVAEFRDANPAATSVASCLAMSL